MEKEVEEKIISLETKLAYMEDFVNQLQAVSVEHTETIERLRTENKLLSQNCMKFLTFLKATFQTESRRIIKKFPGCKNSRGFLF